MLLNCGHEAYYRAPQALGFWHGCAQQGRNTDMGGFPELGVPFLGVPVIKTIVFGGLYNWGLLILGNYHIVLDIVRRVGLFEIQFIPDLPFPVHRLLELGTDGFVRLLPFVPGVNDMWMR